MPLCQQAAEILNEPPGWYEGAEEDRTKLVNFICQCRVPAEQVLLAALSNYLDASYNSHFGCLVAQLKANYPTYDGIFQIHIRQSPEGHNEASKKSGRVNLVISLTRYWVNAKAQPVFGQLFVEATKEPIAEGYQSLALGTETEWVARVSEQYVMEQSIHCAEQIAFMLDGIASRVFNNHLLSGNLELLITGPNEE